MRRDWRRVDRYFQKAEMAMNPMRLLLAPLIGLIFCLSVAPSYAQSSRNDDIEKARAVLAEIRVAIESDEIENAQTAEQRIRTIRDESRQRLSAVDRDLESIQAQLDPLGPAPGENDPPESEDLAAQRGELEAARTRLNSQRIQVNANIFEAGDLLSRLSRTQVRQLYERLLTRGPIPLAPMSIAAATQSFDDVTGRIAEFFANWGGQKSEGGQLGIAFATISVALAISIIMFGPVNRWISRTFSKAIERRRPTSGRRVLVAGLKMIARMIPGVIGGFIILLALREQGIIAAEGAPVARIAWYGLLSVFLVSGFTTGLFAPANPSWRIAQIDTERGQMISSIVLIIALIYFLKTLLSAIGVATDADAALLRMIDASAAIIAGVLMFFLCRRQLWTNTPPPAENETTTNEPANDQHDDRLGVFLRRTTRIVAVIMVAAALFGYVALADFIGTRLILLALFFGLAWFVRAVLMELSLWIHHRLDDHDGDSVEDLERDRQNFHFWTRMIINALLFMAIWPAVIVLFGVPTGRVGDLLSDLLFGFSIGGVRIPSIANFVFAILVFAGILGLTKIFQRGLQKGPLAHSHIDHGVQNSLITLSGYVGLMFAALAAVSTIGFNLQNLALIAGALSLGIGFGLQSIVNNFVSGLILLFERPIKVGDWIVTASGEGTVKRISVRSTEIETFDRSSIIVPNSELISSTVTNWTHKDKIGRVIVKVGVSYNADPEQVRDILLEQARVHPMIVNYPEPFVAWQDFGASSLDFELRAFLNDISNGLRVRSELRFAIFAALNDAGIEIPFPQQDVHVKSLPEGATTKTALDNA